MMKHIGTCVMVMMALLPGALRAQDWGMSWLPILVPSSNEFPFIALGADYSVPAPYEAPYVSNGALSGAAGVTFNGFKAFGKDPSCRSVDAWRNG